MGRSTCLTDDERKQILEMREQKYTNKKIAETLGRSPKVVTRFLKDPNMYGKKRYQGRPNALNEHQKEVILKVASTSSLSAREIAEEAGVDTNPKNIQRLLKKPENFTKFHQDCRLKFANSCKDWRDEWKAVIFSSSRKFYLDGTNEQSAYLNRKTGDASVHVWAAIAYNRHSRLSFLEYKFDAISYTVLLEKELKPFLAQCGDEKYLFQQDNTQMNTTKAVKYWIRTNNVSSLDFPPKSPDINIIENVWGHLGSILYKDNRRFGSINELKSAVANVWEKELDQTFIQGLYATLPERISEVIKSEGGITCFYPST